MKHIVTILLTLAVCFLTFEYVTQSLAIKSLNNTIYAYSLKQQNTMVDLEALKTNISEQMAIEGSEFLSDSILDEENLPINYDSLFHRPRLVFRFYKQNCSSCVSKYMRFLNDFTKETGINPLIISNFESKRSIVLFKKSNNYSGNVYCSDSLLKHERKLPFFFIIGRDYVKRFVFVPEEDAEDLVVEYLNNAKSFLGKTHWK